MTTLDATRDGAASPNASTISIAYTSESNGLEKATVAGAVRLASDYYDNGALRSFALPGGAILTQTYDVANRLASKVVRRGDGAVLSSWDPVTYDENDNRTAESVTQRQLDDTSLSGAASFGYDGADRLVSAKHPLETAAKSYALDDAGT